MFKKIYLSIKELLKGHFTVFKHSFKDAVTLEYPEFKVTMNDKFRGKHTWDSTKCKACRLCATSCPTNAIFIEKNNDEIKFCIDYSRCIFCGNCSFYCASKALKMSNEYELATENKSDLLCNYNTIENEEK